ncbi:hypothetical protein DL766_005804 [Monosporascus sp. MC13-8B]|uniref:Uncharacterized protein n=1 Tax=Monosporascus cannonballus TaxID=155416 RepID=A0ABY0HJG9_9PEZI|nr:hypothetical protein DL763_006941 [Monosporascus cannonballus]RYO94898.1 hypothetical protein DL762_000332 [Monosporascus cannonballus]RYP28581.1 hypothetical protein DL766_005804 [Monosporascus sp. MC13-8B]
MDSVDLRAFCANLASGQVSSVRIFPNPDDAAHDFAALGRALWYAATAPCSVLCFLARASLDAVFVILNLLLWLLCGLLFVVVVLSIYEVAEEKRKAETEGEAKAKCKDRAEEEKEKEKEKKAEKLGGCGMAKEGEASAGNSDKYWMGDKDPDGSGNGSSSGSARGRKNGKERQATEMTTESVAKGMASASQTAGRARIQAASAAAAAADKAAAAAGNDTAAAGPSSSSSRRRQLTPPTIPPIPTSPSPAPQQQQQLPADGYDWFADLDPKLYQQFLFGDGGSS